MPCYPGFDCITSTSSATTDCWTTWTADQGTAASTMTWYHWTNRTDSAVYYPPTREPSTWTPQAVEQARSAALRYAEEQARRSQEIRARAEELLKQHLSEDQQQQFERDREFIVVGSRGTRYKIRENRGSVVANISVLKDDGSEGHRLCCHPRDCLPIADVMLAQKLWLESDEQQFLRVANYHERQA